MKTKKLVFVVSIVLGSLVLYSCNKKNLDVKHSVHYSKKTLFEGLFLGEGEVSKKIALYQENKIGLIPFFKETEKADLFSLFSNRQEMENIQTAIVSKDAFLLKENLQILQKEINNYLETKYGTQINMRALDYVMAWSSYVLVVDSRNIETQFKGFSFNEREIKPIEIDILVAQILKITNN